MDDPYSTPSSENPHSNPKKRFVKLVGVTMKLNVYLMIQAVIIVTSLVWAIVFSFALEGQFLGYEASTIGLILFALVILELGELTYALKKKTFTE